ncbi:MAG: GntR family transcriptional regulator [Lachnospiraceae bacterium]|nr:GntR family transcriptional regulator [Lachnospiraceae bacterium]
MNEQGVGTEFTGAQNRENDQILVVKNHIYSLLKENRIQIGDRLPSEKALSEQLNVTKTAVRDALQSLKAVGLLSSIRGSGYRLTPDFDYSMADILHAMVVYSSSTRRDIREVREALEIKELELLIRSGDSEEIVKKLTSLVELMLSYKGRELVNEEEAETLVQADMEFHRVLAYGSNNLFIRAFNVALNEFHGGGRKVLLDSIRKRVSDELLESHQKILVAIYEEDLLKGIDAIREHYEIGDRVTEEKVEDPLLQTTLYELQEKGFSKQQIMEKLMELNG